MEGTFGVRNAVACGLWSDSTPMNYDRTESLEVLTLAFPGLSGPNSQIRIPLLAFGKKFLAKHITLSQIMDVEAWSFQMALNGSYPIKGYGGEIPDDPNRKRRAGKDLGGVAFLREFKGDRAMFKDVFCFPGWKEIPGICWKWLATPSTQREFGNEAAWRQAPLTHWDVMSKILEGQLNRWIFFSCWFYKKLQLYGLAKCSRPWSPGHMIQYFFIQIFQGLFLALLFPRPKFFKALFFGLAFSKTKDQE